MSEEALFDVEPVARLQKGDKVRIQTMWGVEFGVVEKVEPDAIGFPMVQLSTQSGDRITINIARVAREDPDDDAHE